MMAALESKQGIFEKCSWLGRGHNFGSDGWSLAALGSLSCGLGLLLAPLGEVLGPLLGPVEPCWCFLWAPCRPKELVLLIEVALGPFLGRSGGPLGMFMFCKQILSNVMIRSKNLIDQADLLISLLGCAKSTARRSITSTAVTSSAVCVRFSSTCFFSPPEIRYILWKAL